MGVRSVVWPSPVWLCERVPGQCGGIGVRGCNAEAIDPNSMKPPASPLFRKSGLAGGFFAFGRPSAEVAQTSENSEKAPQRDFSKNEPCREASAAYAHSMGWESRLSYTRLAAG